MSIQVPSPAYGSVAGRDAGTSEADPADPGRPPADPTTSGEPTHAESPTRQNSAHARATIDLMRHPPAAPSRRTDNVRNVPRFGVPPERAWIGRARFGSPGRWGRAR